ncbi:aldose epimerase family protein [Lactiplantibacillus modestisalitolerans]|uniref:Aldose epimerase family protein n=1 Tax=Lactiplantibacillus modestisalitolerans TaxID=1457219 RepID=A0ABV5WT64_9LACO|nr:aldose epimerase family protein [Lactiplantibacillus modestisalitolerans]
MITTTKFGDYQGEPVTCYTLENARGTRLKVLSYAATWVDLQVLVNGAYQSLVTHFDTLAEYVATPYMVGKTVGRVAGRIRNAAFDLNGQHYQLTPNNGSHLLHGGEHGLQTHNFKGQYEPNGDSLTLTTTLLAAEDGFPGDLRVTVTYTLTATDEVQISYTGLSTATTLFNPTCHVYFNLAGPQALVNQQRLQINSHKLVRTDREKLPTGVFYVPSPAYDFQQPVALQTKLTTLLHEVGKTEYDDCYVLDTPGMPAGRLASSQHTLAFSTDRNGLIIFTANPQPELPHQLGEYHALAVELQTLPDAIHHSGFGDIVLPANQPRTFTNHYQYLRHQTC